jgi:hypothetical protein
VPDPVAVPHETDGDAWRAITGEQLLELMGDALGPHRYGRPHPDDVGQALRQQEVERLSVRLYDAACGHLQASTTDTERDREDRALGIFRAWLAWHLDHDLIPQELR